ncbi:hypothetical protein [Endozoicomonas lisbonensis]
MLNRSLPAFILAVSSCYCGADSVGRDEFYNPCDSAHYDISREASPGEDLLDHLKAIRGNISKKTAPSDVEFSGSGSGFYLDTNRTTGKNNFFEAYIKKQLNKFKHSSVITSLNSDDEDYISSGSATDEIQSYSGRGPSGYSKMTTALILLKPSETPYKMSGSIDVSGFSLTICSPVKNHQDGIVPEVKDDKPATIKLAPVSSSNGSDRSDIKPQKAWFSVTEKGELSIVGVFLDAFESKENFPVIYADGESKVALDWSDIIRTTSEPDAIKHSNRSMIVVRRGTQVPRIHIAHSRLYSNLHKGSIIKSTPVPDFIVWSGKNRITIDVSNSYLYVPEGTAKDQSYFDIGTLATLTRKKVCKYFSATPDHYKYFVQTNSDNPLKLLNNHYAYSDRISMTDYIPPTPSEMSGHTPFTQSHSTAYTVKAGMIPLILSFAHAWF